MIYGKLNGGLLEQAPYHMVKNKVDYCGYNFDSNRDMLLADGYKPVETLNDKSGYHDCDGTFSFVFEEEDDKIVEKAVFKKYSDEEKAQQVREQRDRLLQQTDKLMVSDYPIEAEAKAQMAAYRQYLRDIPQGGDFPWVKIQTFDEWRENANS